MLDRVLDVSTSGYDAMAPQPASGGPNKAGTDLIRAIHAARQGTYGAPRVWAELLMAHGVSCSRKRVARLMRQMGLQKDRRTGRSLTGIPTGRSSRTACHASSAPIRPTASGWPT